MGLTLKNMGLPTKEYGSIVEENGSAPQEYGSMKNFTKIKDLPLKSTIVFLLYP